MDIGIELQHQLRPKSAAEVGRLHGGHEVYCAVERSCMPSGCLYAALALDGKYIEERPEDAICMLVYMRRTMVDVATHLGHRRTS